MKIGSFMVTFLLLFWLLWYVIWVGCAGLGPSVVEFGVRCWKSSMFSFGIEVGGPMLKKVQWWTLWLNVELLNFFGGELQCWSSKSGVGESSMVSFGIELKLRCWSSGVRFQSSVLKFAFVIELLLRCCASLLNFGIIYIYIYIMALFWGLPKLV